MISCFENIYKEISVWFSISLSNLFSIRHNKLINEIIPPAGRELGKLEELPQHLRETWLLVCRIFGKGTERSLLC